MSRDPMLPSKKNKEEFIQEISLSLFPEQLYHDDKTDDIIYDLQNERILFRERIKEEM